MRTLLIAGIAFGILIMNVFSSLAESPAPKYAIGLGLDISSGKFGADSTSTFVSAPLVIDWFPSERLYFELTVPFLYQRTTNNVHSSQVMNGQVAAKTVTKSVAYMSGSGGGGGGMFGSGDYGLGDITLTSGYSLLMDSDSKPNLRPTVYVKFPTADESKGLGTGAFDFGAGLVVSKWFGNWQPFTEGRYVVQGASGAENFITADAGVAYSISDTLVTSLYGRFGSSQFSGYSAPLEARIKASWRFAERTYTDVYALKGFSDGSPDYGGGVSVFVEF